MQTRLDHVVIRQPARAHHLGRLRRALALGCLATVAVADLTIRRLRPPWIVVGLLDEPAHVATAGLVLLNLGARSPEWSAGFMAGSILPDVDHVPLALSGIHRSLDNPRPVTHCLLVAAPLLAAARAVPARAARDAAAGAAAGTLAHFARDLAVGTGVALFRPLSVHHFKIPYPLYAVAVAALAARAAGGIKPPTGGLPR